MLNARAVGIFLLSGDRVLPNTFGAEFNMSCVFATFMHLSEIGVRLAVAKAISAPQRILLDMLITFSKIICKI